MAATTRHHPTPRRPVPNGRPVAQPRTATSSREEVGNSLFPYSVGAVIHGTQGVGKTAMLAHLPKVGFIVSKKEQGVRDLVAAKQAPEPEFVEVFDNQGNLKENPPWDRILSLNYSIAGGGRGIENLVIDSLTWVEAVGFRRDCKDNYEGDFGKEGYFAWQTGPKSFAKSMWQDYLDSLEDIKDAGINVWLIAHTTIKGHNAPGEPTYDRYIPYLDKEVWAQTHAWAQLVLFYNFDVSIQATDKEGKRGRVKKDSQSRLIYTERTEGYDAKNRWGMSPVITAGSSGEEAYENLKKEIDKCFSR